MRLRSRSNSDPGVPSIKKAAQCKRRDETSYRKINWEVAAADFYAGLFSPKLGPADCTPERSAPGDSDA